MVWVLEGIFKLLNHFSTLVFYIILNKKDLAVRESFSGDFVLSFSFCGLNYTFNMKSWNYLSYE